MGEPDHLMTTRMRADNPHLKELQACHFVEGICVQGSRSALEAGASDYATHVRRKCERALALEMNAAVLTGAFIGDSDPDRDLNPPRRTKR